MEKVTYMIGDKMELALDGFGTFTATVQKITDTGIIFMFDDCIIEMPMNIRNTNEGGYENSILCKWINSILKEAFPDDIKAGIINISLPSYGQIFGHDEFYAKYVEEDNDERFELMKLRKNRVGYYEDDFEWYWLKNSIKNTVSATDFANVYSYGSANGNGAAYSCGVRPVFTLSI